MSEPGYADKMYKAMIENYNRNGEKFLYNGCKIIDMDNKQIKNEIYSINNNDAWFDPRTRGWVDIFDDVLKTRRRNKLKKIKSNIVI